MNVRFGVVVAALALGLSGCGGGGTSGSPVGMATVTYSVGGTVTGLTGAGLVLQVNGGGNLAIAALSTSFAFASPIPATTIYTVTVLTQPAGQICTVANGSGTVTGPVTNIAVTCGVTIGGNVTGLVGTLVLQNNGGSDLTISANGVFTFPNAVLNGSTYDVTVLSKPTNQVCPVTNPTGTATANVTNVTVACAVNGFSIGTVLDPLAIQQWHLKNIGQNAFADGTGIAGMDINVDPVFTNFGFTGSGVTVAVVDTGMEILHEDLAANVVAGGSWNFINSTTDPTNTIDTTGDHGSSVAGLIAMARNTVGGIGVAPRASLKGFNFLSSDQLGTKFGDSIGGSSANPNSSDVFIFNQSFGISPTNDVAIDPTDEAHYLSGVTSLRGAKGAIYVKAAGNGFSNIGDPPSTAPCAGAIPSGLSCENANFDPANSIPYQIVVGAVNADGIKASYSTAGSAIWVSAPGGEFGFNASVAPGLVAQAYEPAMVTTDQSGCTDGFSRTAASTSTFNKGTIPSTNTNCNYTNTMNGTSSATPVTVGVIALILEANPALTWRDVKHILAFTARKIDPGRAAVSIALTGGNYVAEPQWTTNAATPHAFQFHNWYGFGMVDASAAVTMAQAYTPGQLGTFADTGLIPSPVLSLAIPDNSLTGVTNSLTVPVNPVHVIEAVQISVTATHPFVGDLGIELISPLGTRSVLKNIRDGFFDSNDLNGMVLLSNAFYGENPAGAWTIKVVDGGPANLGTLTGWKIRVFGH